MNTQNPYDFFRMISPYSWSINRRTINCLRLIPKPYRLFKLIKSMERKGHAKKFLSL